MSTDRARAIAALVIAALLFGLTFVVVKAAVEEVRPLAFVGWRFLIGGAALTLLAVPTSKGVWRDGFLAGLWMFAGFALQTGGLTLTGASNSALLTGLYPVFTPLLAAAVRRVDVRRGGRPGISCHRHRRCDDDLAHHRREQPVLGLCEQLLRRSGVASEEHHRREPARRRPRR